MSVIVTAVFTPAEGRLGALDSRVDGLLAEPVEVTRLVPIPVGAPARGAL